MMFSEHARKYEERISGAVQAMAAERGAARSFVYEYVTPDNRHLFCVARFEYESKPKTFLAFRVEQDGAINYKTPTLEKIPLYGVTTIPEDDERPVFIVEGEKKADLLRHEGLIAVSPFGGAGNAHRADVYPLVNKDVILIPDEGVGGERWTMTLGAGLNDIMAKPYVISLNKLVCEERLQVMRDALGKDKLDIYDLYEFFQRDGENTSAWDEIISKLKVSWRHLGERCTAMPKDLEAMTKKEGKKMTKTETKAQLIKETLRRIDIVVAENGGFGCLDETGHVVDIRKQEMHLVKEMIRVSEEKEVEITVDSSTKAALRNHFEALSQSDMAERWFRSVRRVKKISTTRSAVVDDVLFYNLGNKRGEVMIADKEGVRIVSLQEAVGMGVGFYQPPEGITEMEAQAPASIEEAVSILKEGRKLFSPALSEGRYAQLLAYMIYALRDDSPQMILALEGEAGSGKTTTAATIVELLDPPVNSIGRMDSRIDLTVKAIQHRIVLFDNITTLPINTIDTICTYTTSPQLSERLLYRNESLSIGGYKAVILTSTHPIWERSDLADRVMVINHRRVGDHGNFSSAKHWQDVKRMRGKILGAIMYLASQGFRHVDDEDLGEDFGTSLLIRNKDFLRFALACFRDTPWREAFLDAVAGMQAEITETLINDEVVDVMQRFINEMGGIIGFRKYQNLIPIILRYVAEFTMTIGGSSESIIKINHYKKVLDMIEQKPEFFINKLISARHAFTRLGYQVKRYTDRMLISDRRVRFNLNIIAPINPTEEEVKRLAYIVTLYTTLIAVKGVGSNGKPSHKCAAMFLMRMAENFGLNRELITEALRYIANHGAYARPALTPFPGSCRGLNQDETHILLMMDPVDFGRGRAEDEIIVRNTAADIINVAGEILKVMEEDEDDVKTPAAETDGEDEGKHELPDDEADDNKGEVKEEEDENKGEVARNKGGRRESLLDFLYNDDDDDPPSNKPDFPIMWCGLKEGTGSVAANDDQFGDDLDDDDGDDLK